ncbi:MAG: hypothetical protein NTV44_04625 [Firmicutes bacterium]|nr:hypothetical protein [Bacillota bacterium]
MFIKLTENDKRVLIAICIVIFLVFILIGYLGLLIERIMKRQARDLDTSMHDVVSTGVVDTPRYFRRIAFKKNARLFYKQSRYSFLIVFVSVAFLYFYLLYIRNFDLNFLFDYQTKGINTLFFIFDWSLVPFNTFFGLTLPSGWPPLLSAPHFMVEAWPSYVFMPLFTVGMVWLLINIQALIARTFRLLKMSSDVFKKNLDTVVPGGEFKRTKE